MYLCSYLRQNGYDATIIDQANERFEPEILMEKIGAENPDIIGISGIITAFGYVKDLMKLLKNKFPDKLMVIGGHITLDIEDILLTELKFDYVINSYGEKKLLHLIDYLQGTGSLEDISGISYCDNNKIVTHSGEFYFKDIDLLPYPAYDLIDMEYYSTVSSNNPKLKRYLEKTGKEVSVFRTFPVMGALGCTDKCSFCIHEFYFRGFRLHSVDYVIENVRFLYDNYNIRVFVFGEDLFLFNTKYASKFICAMNENFPDAFFQCAIRSDYVSEEMLDLLRNSNCYTLGFGFESANDDILNILYKRNSGKNNVRAYKLIRDTTDMTPACSFMVGAPGETERTVDDTIDAIREAKITDSAVFITNPYPGTRLYRWCLEQGLIRDRMKFLSQISDRDAIKLGVNMTAYPDFIVKMMRIMVLNQLEKNKMEIDPGFRISLFSRIVNHTVVPLIYRSYFRLKSFHYADKGNFEDIKLNEKKTVLLNGEKRE